MIEDTKGNTIQGEITEEKQHRNAIRESPQSKYSTRIKRNSIAIWRGASQIQDSSIKGLRLTCSTIGAIQAIATD